MEREGPIFYSDCVNLTSKYSLNMFICIYHLCKHCTCILSVKNKKEQLKTNEFFCLKMER